MNEPRCDLILLSWNHLELTQPCLASLVAHTDVPVRLFIVDNGSEPPVRQFLQSFRPQGAITEVVLLQNKTNEGFPRGMNRGLRASQARFTCLLNNDLVFAPHWLSRLLEVAEAHPEIGVVNPASSTFGEFPPPGCSLEAYAQTLEPRRRSYVEVGMCIGFCMLIKREVIERIGVLSEENERFSYEDEDYCMRAHAAGFRCVVARASYVYHAERRTISKIPDHELVFRRSKAWCERRWGRWVRIAWPRFTPIAPGSDELRRWLGRLVAWARRRTYVYVYCPTPFQVTPDELFRSVGLVPHADIHWRPIPQSGARWAAAGLILKRRKKRFDIILAPTAGWGMCLSRLGWLHGATVVPVDDEARLTAHWHASRGLP